jgi:hypothetical protein
MANDSKRVSQLGVTSTLSLTDRVLVLTNPSSAANVQTITVNNFANALGNTLSIFSTNIIPATDNTYSLGNSSNQWQSLYVSANAIYVGGTPLSVVNGALAVNGVSISTTNTNIAVTYVSSNSYIANISDEIILCDPNTAGNNITVTLPVPAANGKIYTVKNINGEGYNVYVQSSDSSSTIEVHGAGILNSYDNIANSGNTVTWVYGQGAYRVIAYG